MLLRKSRWRSWLGLKGELWYYFDSGPRKKPDRPHGMTIAIGLLSPLLAIVAAYISFKVLATNRESLQVSQRAYLAVEEPKLVLTKEADEGKYAIVVVDLTFSIKNLGNTPASIAASALDIQIPGWKQMPDIVGTDKEVPIFGMPKVVTPKFNRLASFHIRYGLDRAKAIELDRRGKIRVWGRLSYLDVFDEPHDWQWCWIELRGKDKAGNYLGIPAGPLTDCADDTILPMMDDVEH